MRRPDHIIGPYWEPRDVWIGVFWDRGWVPGEIARRRTNVYVCFVPCFPIRLVWVDPKWRSY